MAENILYSKKNIWTAYVEAFNYFTFKNIREECHPRILEHPNNTSKAIVLVHGLSDSPYFVTFIGDYFHHELGYNVYMPLLHFHGLKDPKGMEGVELEEWEQNVGFALDFAEDKCDFVSIGGLSTGGALSFLMANSRPGINGTLFLFSAALDLAGGPLGLWGDMKEWLLRTSMVDILDQNKPMVGDNPYRYSHVDLDGARELARLIKRTDIIMHGFSKKHLFPLRVFAAHSEADTVANIAGIKKLQEVCDPRKFHFEIFPKKDEISHAGLVLKEPISGIEKEEKENPNFNDMMKAVKSFECRQEI